MKHDEYQIQKQVCQYLNWSYRDVLFISTGIPFDLSDKRGARNKAIQKPNFKCPDLIIFEARNGYNGLFIELKVVTPFKKDGNIKKDVHLEGQLKTIQELEAKGYFSVFATGFGEAKIIIDKYLR